MGDGVAYSSVFLTINTTTYYHGAFNYLSVSMSFYDQFMRLSVRQRTEIAESAGLSIGYVMKHTYVSDRAPKFHFHNAVAIDHASKGVISFIEHTTGDVDWDYVRRALNRAKKRGEL